MPADPTTISSAVAECLATAKDCPSGARGLHCEHYRQGDGDCCNCGRENWCPDAGVADPTPPPAPAQLLAIIEAEPWLLHRPAECVNIRCTEKWWCIGCDPDGDESCSASPWPCAIVRDKHPAYAAAYAEGEERGWHRGFDHARRYPAPGNPTNGDGDD